MAGRGLFTTAHIASMAARAAELEREGEEIEDPGALMRAARLYTLAVRIADDISGRGAAVFTRGDLFRVRDELRVLAAAAAAVGVGDGDGRAAAAASEARITMTRAFREIALRIEERLLADETLPRREPGVRPRA